MSRLELKPFQEGAIVAHREAKNRGIVVLPTGAGKTLVAARIIENWLSQNIYPVLWVAHTIDLVRQAKEELHKNHKIPEDKAFVTTIQSFNTPGKRAKARAKFRGIVVDECHHAASAIYQRLLISGESGFDATLGLTGTAYRSGEFAKAEWQMVIAALGDIVYQSEREDVENSGLILKPQAAIIKFEGHVLPPAPSYHWIRDKTTARKLKVAKEIKNGVVYYRPRNDLVVNLALFFMESLRVVLVIVREKEQGRYITQKINQANPGKAQLITSNMPKKKRKEYFKFASEGRLLCVIGTSLLNEGVDIPIASVIIMGAGGVAKGQQVQRAGRVVRAYPHKVTPMIIDFFDDQQGYKSLLGHSFGRIKTYKREGFPVQIMDEIQLYLNAPVRR